MNFLPLLLGFLAFQMFANKKPKPDGKENNAGMFENLGNGILAELLNNPEAMASLGSITKLFDKKAPQDEKTAAIFSLLSNPAVFEIAKQFFMQQSEQKDTAYTSPPSEESQEAFRPVSNIAGVEISDKLCHLYDNWYIKK